MELFNERLCIGLSADGAIAVAPTDPTTRGLVFVNLMGLLKKCSSHRRENPGPGDC